MGTPVESGGGTVTESGLGGGSTESGAGGGGGAVESPPGEGGTIVSGGAGIESGERGSIGTSGASDVTNGSPSPHPPNGIGASASNAALSRSVRRRRVAAPISSYNIIGSTSHRRKR